MKTRSEAIQAILDLQDQKPQIRKQERMLDRQEGFGSLEGISNSNTPQENLLEFLKSFMPEELIPTNVGKLENVLWPFHYEVDFSDADDAMFGNNPTYTRYARVGKNFKTLQDSAFLLIGMSRNFNTHGSAGKGAPLEVTLKDSQSARQLNNEPFNVQFMGANSVMTKFPAPYFVSPTGTMRVELSTFIENNVTLVGDGSQFFTFYGYEVRSAELENVLTNIYTKDM
jgi:hypothetical protein